VALPGRAPGADRRSGTRPRSSSRRSGLTASTTRASPIEDEDLIVPMAGCCARAASSWRGARVKDRTVGSDASASARRSPYGADDAGRDAANQLAIAVENASLRELRTSREQVAGRRGSPSARLAGVAHDPNPLGRCAPSSSSRAAHDPSSPRSSPACLRGGRDRLLPSYHLRRPTSADQRRRDGQTERVCGLLRPAAKENAWSSSRHAGGALAHYGDGDQPEQVL
jgi:hypothetical protein